MPHTTVDVQILEKGTGAAAAAFGVAGVAAPALLTAIYGMDEASGDFRFMSRLWGTRTGVLGGLMLAAQDEGERRRITIAAAAMNLADVAIALATPGLSTRTRVLAAGTSGLFAAIGGYALTGTQA